MSSAVVNQGNAPEPAADGSAAQQQQPQDDKENKKKDKKKDKKGAAGIVLGKGCAVLRTHLERAVAASAAATAGNDSCVGQSQTLLLLAEGQLAAGDAVLSGAVGVAAVEGVISVHQAAALKLSEDLKVVVEANQARRKPKVGRLICHIVLFETVAVRDQ